MAVDPLTMGMAVAAGLPLVIVAMGEPLLMMGLLMTALGGL